MKKKVIDLENGHELVVWGDFKHGYDYPQHILETIGTGHDSCGILIRKTKK